jgi:hypothetical protein
MNSIRQQVHVLPGIPTIGLLLAGRILSLKSAHNVDRAHCREDRFCHRDHTPAKLMRSRKFHLMP